MLRLLRGAHQKLGVVVRALQGLDKHVHGALGVVRVRQDAAHRPDKRGLLRSRAAAPPCACRKPPGRLPGKCGGRPGCGRACSSMLPVPLNSSKITSSIFEPVSTSADGEDGQAEPSVLRCCGPRRRTAWAGTGPLESTPPERTCARRGLRQVVGARQAGDASRARSPRL